MKLCDRFSLSFRCFTETCSSVKLALDLRRELQSCTSIVEALQRNSGEPSLRLTPKFCLLSTFPPCRGRRRQRHSSRTRSTQSAPHDPTQSQRTHVESVYLYSISQSTLGNYTSFIDLSSPLSAHRPSSDSSISPSSGSL